MGALRAGRRAILLQLLCAPLVSATAIAQLAATDSAILAVGALTKVRQDARGFAEFASARSTDVALRVSNASIVFGLSKDSLAVKAQVSPQSQYENVCLADARGGEHAFSRAKCVLADFDWYVEVGEPEIRDRAARVTVRVYRAIRRPVTATDYAFYTVCFDLVGTTWRPQHLYCEITRP